MNFIALLVLGTCCIVFQDVESSSDFIDLKKFLKELQNQNINEELKVNISQPFIQKKSLTKIYVFDQIELLRKLLGPGEFGEDNTNRNQESDLFKDSDDLIQNQEAMKRGRYLYSRSTDFDEKNLRALKARVKPAKRRYLKS